MKENELEAELEELEQRLKTAEYLLGGMVILIVFLLFLLTVVVGI